MPYFALPFFIWRSKASLSASSSALMPPWIFFFFLNIPCPAASASSSQSPPAASSSSITMRARTAAPVIPVFLHTSLSSHGITVYAIASFDVQSAQCALHNDAATSILLPGPGGNNARWHVLTRSWTAQRREVHPSQNDLETRYEYCHRVAYRQLRICLSSEDQARSLVNACGSAGVLRYHEPD